MGFHRMPEVTAEQENFRLEEIAPNVKSVKRDPVEPVPVGTYVACVMRVDGYDQDADGSLMARLVGVDKDGQTTGLELKNQGLYPQTEVVIDSPSDLFGLIKEPEEIGVVDLEIVTYIQSLLPEGDYHKMEIGPSAIAMSPHQWLYIFLTDREHEGPHIIVSAAREYEDLDGFFVGGFSHYERDDGEGPVWVGTADEVPGVVAACARKLREETND